MKPAPFEYHAPDTIDGVLMLLAEHGDAAKVLAGGQSLIPTMNFRLAQPAVLIDLGRLSELAYIHPEVDGGLAIGAMTRQRTVEKSTDVARRAPLVHMTMPFVAHPQIRNQGTFGGSIAHADPAAELPAVMLALGATFVVKSPDGERRIPASEFYVGLFTTALEPGEMLVRVEIPAPAPGTRSAFEEVSRRHGDFALAGVAVSVTPGADGSVADATICLLSVGDGPVTAVAGAEALRGAPLSDATIAAAVEATAGELDPPGDIHATPAYRRHLAGVLTRRALERARRA